MIIDIPDAPVDEDQILLNGKGADVNSCLPRVDQSRYFRIR